MLHKYDYSPVKYAVAIVTEKGDMFAKTIFVLPNFLLENIHIYLSFEYFLVFAVLWLWDASVLSITDQIRLRDVTITTKSISVVSGSDNHPPSWTSVGPLPSNYETPCYTH